MRESLRQYCRRVNLDWLADEFDIVRNAPLTPDTVSYGSKRPVWWRCAKGHEWQAAPDARNGGARCPYCAGIRPVPGVNDLATAAPALAAEWHPTKNGALTPRELLANSKKLVWWRCEKGHEYTASPKSRACGGGCPICKQEREERPRAVLADVFPQLAAEWNGPRNSGLTPEHVLIDSPKRVWWRCAKGHEWQAAIDARTAGGSGCPVCSGRKLQRGVNDLKTVNPVLAAQFAAENAPLTASDVAANSSKRVWWRCRNGHLWRASVKDRTGAKHSGCPRCAAEAKLPAARPTSLRVYI